MNKLPSLPVSLLLSCVPAHIPKSTTCTETLSQALLSGEPGTRHYIFINFPSCYFEKCVSSYSYDVSISRMVLPLFTCPYDLDPLFSGISNFIPLISSYKHQQSLYILQRPSPLKPLSNFLIKEFAFTTFVGSILTHSSTHCDLATIP